MGIMVLKRMALLTYVDGKFGQAAKFDGSAAYIDVPHSPSLNLQQMTIAAWVYDIGNGEQVVLFKGRYNGEWHTNNQRQYQLYTTKTQAKFAVFSSDIDWKELTSNVDDTHINQWRHIVATYDGEKMKVFVNGQLDSEQEMATELFQPTNPESLTIGAAFNVNNGERGNEGFYRNGLIDDIRVYNRALSEDEVKQLYQLGNSDYSFFVLTEPDGFNDIADEQFDFVNGGCSIALPTRRFNINP